MSDAARAAALRHLTSDPAAERPESLYFLVDAARDPDIYPRLRDLSESGGVVVGLYEGAAAADLAAVAPYILECAPGGQAFEWLWSEGWGEDWGLFAHTAASVLDLRAHFRRLTQVRTEDGRVMLFRFYDPRVFAAFAPTCDAMQTEALFGPICAFWIDNGERGLTEFMPADGKVLVRDWPLADAMAQQA